MSKLGDVMAEKITDASTAVGASNAARVIA